MLKILFILTRIIKLSFIFCLATVITAGMSSCKTKEGCGLEEKYNNPDMETSKRGKSDLWSKKQKKRMKKG